MSFLNALFPAKCVICSNLFVFKDQNLFCDECLSMINKEYVEYCSGCGSKIKNCQSCFKKRVFYRIKIFKNNDRYITELIYQFKIKGYKNLSTVIAKKIPRLFWGRKKLRNYFGGCELCSGSGTWAPMPMFTGSPEYRRHDSFRLLW